MHDPLFQRRGGDVGFSGGLVIGLLIAIPLWMLIAVALNSAFQRGPFDGGTRVALLVAAVCEFLLARHALKPHAARLWRRWFPVFNRSAWNTAHRQRHAAGPAPSSGPGANSDFERIAGMPGRPSTMRQTAAFASLSVAYLHYYFWDVNLQIASLHSLTVFVAVTPLQKIAT